MEDELIHELSAAYALDALTSDERDVYQAHLASCRRCRLDVAAFSEAAAALAFASPPASPPAALRARILKSTRAQEPRRMRPRLHVPRYTLAAVAACAAFVVGVLATASWPLVGSSRSTTLHTLALHGASGSIVLTQGGEAALTVTGLPRASTGKTYEIWVMRGTVSLPAGTFTAQPDTVSVRLRRTVPAGSFVGVTIEPAGGSPRPTSKTLFTSTPA